MGGEEVREAVRAGGLLAAGPAGRGDAVRRTGLGVPAGRRGRAVRAGGRERAARQLRTARAGRTRTSATASGCANSSGVELEVVRERGRRCTPAQARGRCGIGQPAGVGARACATRAAGQHGRGARRADRDRAHGERPGGDDPVSAGRLPGRRALLGMAASEGRLIRPLLAVTREQTAAYCEARGLRWREDESNDSEQFARARVRHGLVKALRAVHPAAEANVLRTARLLREETELLDGLVAPELAGRKSIAIARLGRCRRRWRAWWWCAWRRMPRAPTSPRRATAWRRSSRSPAAAAGRSCTSGARRAAVIERRRPRDESSSRPRLGLDSHARGHPRARSQSSPESERCSSPPRTSSAAWRELGEEISRDYAGRLAAAGGGAEGRRVLPERPDALHRHPGRGRLHGRRLLWLGDGLLGGRAHPQGSRRRDRRSRRADRRGHRGFRAHAAVPACATSARATRARSRCARC